MAPIQRITQASKVAVHFALSLAILANQLARIIDWCMQIWTG